VAPAVMVRPIGSPSLPTPTTNRMAILVTRPILWVATTSVVLSVTRYPKLQFRSDWLPAR
jgi:hypothetical protein